MSTRLAAVLLPLVVVALGVARPANAAEGDDPRLREASAALEAGDAAKAARLCDAVLAERPADADALAGLARAARRGAGDLLAAENRLESAASRAPAADRARLLVETGLLRLARGQALVNEGRGTRSTIVALFRDAVHVFEAARDAGASGDELAIGLADALEWAEKPEDAEKVLAEELARRPEALAVRSTLASLLSRRPGREADAREAARAVFDADAKSPGAAEVAMAIGRMELGADDVDRAFAAYARVLEAAPSAQAVYDDVWDATAARRRFDLADRLLTLVMGRFPRDAKAPYYRAHARLLEGRLADAEKDFGAAIQADPAFREARLGLAEARRRAGDRAGAAAALREILAARPADDAALDALRTVAEEIAFAGDDAAAGALFEIVSTARPSDRETRVNWAVACARTGRPDDGRRVLEAGVARDPGDVRLRNELAIALRAAHDEAGAERELRAALATDFQFDAAENLAFLLIETGREKEAVPILADILRRDPARIRSAIAYERATRRG